MEHIVVETLSLEKKLEIMKKFNYFDTFEVGKFVDAMDTVNSWCLAEIVNIDQRTLNIHFDGWSAKWDCVRIHSYSHTSYYSHTIDCYM